MGASGAIEFRGKAEMWGSEAEPFATDVVQVGEDGGDGASAAGGWLGAPDAGIEIFEQELVDGVVNGEGFEEDGASNGVGIGG